MCAFMFQIFCRSAPTAWGLIMCVICVYDVCMYIYMCVYVCMCQIFCKSSPTH